MNGDYGVDVSNEGRGDVRLSVWGIVDGATAPEMLDAILCAAFTYDQGQVIIDLAGVSHLDPTGLAALRAAHRNLVADGTRLSVRNPNAEVTKVLHVSGLDTYLNIESDLEPGPPVLRRVG